MSRCLTVINCVVALFLGVLKYRNECGVNYPPSLFQVTSSAEMNSRWRYVMSLPMEFLWSFDQTLSQRPYSV